MAEDNSEENVCQAFTEKITKAQAYNKNYLEKGKEDTLPLKSFEILPSKSFMGLLAVKMAK